MLKSFNTPEKQVVRKKFRKFIKLNLLKHKRPKDVTVLCLPSWEALEILEVYDKLAIPRRNIWGVEIDKEAYNILKSKNLGINLYKMDVVDFLKTTSVAFDIVNLDFCGHITSRIVDSIEHLFKRKLLKEKGILAVTYLAMRENKELSYLFYNKIVMDVLRMIADFFKPNTEVERCPIHEDRFHVRRKFTAKGKFWCISEDYKIPSDKDLLERYCIDKTIADIALGVYWTKMAFYLIPEINREVARRISDDFPEDILYEGKKIDFTLVKIGELLNDMLWHAIKELDVNNSYVVKKLERYQYMSGVSKMRTSFFQFEKLIDEYNRHKARYQPPPDLPPAQLPQFPRSHKYWKDLLRMPDHPYLSIEEWLAWEERHNERILNVPVLTIQIRQPPPSKKEVIQAIKKGLI